jgi:hypothetical protein
MHGRNHEMCMSKLAQRWQKRLAIMRALYVTLAAAIASLSLVAIAAIASPAGEPTEYAVKAAFLFKFGAFVDWPAGAFENPGAPLVIGIVGEDPFGEALDTVVANHTIAGRPVVIQRGRQIDQIRNEHILFISQSEKGRMNPILANLAGKNVLTVAEFQNPNIIIQFVVENDKVRFDVNLAQAERAGIKLSSKLLSVARHVTKE